MKIFTSLAALLAVALVTACGETPDDSHLQEKVINGFYQQHIKTHSLGIPGPDELRQLQPFLSPVLFALLSKASDAEARYHAGATDHALPPLVDGDLFTSLFEGATSFALDSCESANARASCTVRFRYQADDKGNNGASDESWRDKLLLVKDKQQWRIDDIEFVGNSQSSQTEYLTDTLNSIVNDYQ